MMECINLITRVQNLYLVLSIEDKIHDSWHLALMFLFGALAFFIISIGFSINSDNKIFAQISKFIALVSIILMAYFAYNAHQMMKNKTDSEKDNKSIEMSYDDLKPSMDLNKFDINDYQIEEIQAMNKKTGKTEKIKVKPNNKNK